MKNILVTIFMLFLLLLQSCSINEPKTNNLITALTKFDDVGSIVSEYSQGLILKSVFSKEVKYNGQAEKWIYKYSSGGIAVDYYYHATESKVRFDSTSTMTLDGEGLIVNQWFNSDEAMRIAEENGGKKFRETNLEYNIEISLVEPMIPNSVTYWFVKYISKTGNNEILHLGINSLTKEVNLYY